ncbi:YqaJ viral recombinase family protein [Azospirillum palustre]
MNAILPTSREHWHEIRAQHVGGSEVASLFYLWRLADGQQAFLHMFEQPPAGAECLGCASRHTTGYRLYWQKRGVLPPENLDEVERVQAGQFLEPAIAEWAQHKWDPWPLRKVHRYLRHPRIAGMGVSRDFEEHAPGLPPVEIKNVDYLVFRDLWKTEGEEITAPPLDITLQLQHQIACEGRVRAEHGWIVACVGGNKLYRGQIARHDPTITRIEQAVAAFWQAVESETPPLDIADFDTVAEMSLLGAETRAAPLDLTADNELPILCAEFLKTDASVKASEVVRDRLKAQIAGKLGDSPETIRAAATGFNITWPLVRRGEKTHRGGLTIREC